MQLVRQMKKSKFNFAYPPNIHVKQQYCITQYCSSPNEHRKVFSADWHKLNK